MGKLWRWWKDWRPLFLWPLALVLFTMGLYRGLFGDDYARGAFLLLLGHIIDLNATEAANKFLAHNDTERPDA
jgi:hypothetical protein